MNRKFIPVLIVILIGLPACKKHVINFSVQNSSTDTILVKYIRKSNVTDTLLLQMYPSYYSSSYSFLHQEFDTPASNWWDHCPIEVSYIININGDTINFNPNLQENWQIMNADTYHNYYLRIDDASF